jgi:ribonuclease HII
MSINRQKVNLNKNHFEKIAWKLSQTVMGIDEVGRGCLAGPLVTAAVILPPNKTSRLIADSKILTSEERLKAYAWIIKHCHYNIGILHNRLIDKHNIWQTTLLAMKKALINLLATCPENPSAILVDAMPLTLEDTNYSAIPVHHFPFGEQKSISIAAASIIAKVTRDNLMQQYEAIFPGYSLGRHKGYSTKIHKHAINSIGYSIIHRMSFLSWIHQQKEDYDSQQTIC